MHKFIYFLILFSALAAGVFAQVYERKFEVGGVVSVINLNDVNGEKPVGVGARFGYNFHKHVGFDSEVTYFPQDGQGNFGETIAVAGLKAGYRGEKVGIFAKARPGIAHFGSSSYRALGNNEPTKFALDLGGIVEFYPSSRFIVRVDVGDTIIPFGDDIFRTSLPLTVSQPGTSHNLQTSFGLGYRF